MASFSPTFTIDITDDIAAGANRTVTNPGVAFVVVGLLVSGTATAVVTVKKNTGAGATAATATVIAAGSSCQITDANASFSATDNIYVASATEAVTRVTLICRSAAASAWTNT